MSASLILIIVAFILAVLAIVKPAWPLCAVSCLLICVVLLIQINGKG